MKLIIDIDEEIYKMCKRLLGDADEIERAIANGIPLPKEHGREHGRLIDADALIKSVCIKFYTTPYYKHILDAIDNAPTVFDEKAYSDGYTQGTCDCEHAHERPQGEWIKHIDNLFPEESTEECPFCHEEQRLVGNDDNFCPNCGADMRKEAEDG